MVFKRLTRLSNKPRLFALIPAINTTGHLHTRTFNLNKNSGLPQEFHVEGSQYVLSKFDLELKRAFDLQRKLKFELAGAKWLDDKLDNICLPELILEINRSAIHHEPRSKEFLFKNIPNDIYVTEEQFEKSFTRLVDILTEMFAQQGLNVAIRLHKESIYRFEYYYELEILKSQARLIWSDDRECGHLIRLLAKFEVL